METEWSGRLSKVYVTQKKTAGSTGPSLPCPGELAAKKTHGKWFDPEKVTEFQDIHNYLRQKRYMVLSITPTCQNNNNNNFPRIPSCSAKEFSF